MTDPRAAAAELPSASRSRGRSITIRTVARRGLIAALLMSALIGGPGFVAVVSIRSSVERIVHTLDPLQSENTAILQSLSAADSAIRGYELTGKAAYREQYADATTTYRAALAAAESSTRGDSAASAAIAQVRIAASGWLSIANPLASPAAPRAMAATTAALASGFSRIERASAAANDELAAEIRAAGANADSDQALALGFVGLTAVFGLVLAAAFRVRTLRMLVHPLEALVAATTSLRAGDRTARVEPKGPAEIRAVALALNALADRLRDDDRRRARVRALSELITRDVRERVDLTAMLEDAVSSIGVAFDADRVFVRLTEDGVVRDIAAQWHREGLLALGSEANRPRGVTGQIQRRARSGERLVIEDSTTDERFDNPDNQAHFARLGLRSGVICPITAVGELIGTLVVVSGAPRNWFEDEVGLIEIAAGELGRALQHAYLFAAQRDLVEQLQELDRSKTEFLSTVSHELRTPLTSITGYIEMLEDGEAGPVTEQQKKMLEVVDRNARRLRGLIEDLLTLSRIEVGAFRVTFEPVDVVELVRAVAQVVEPTIHDKGLVLTTEFADDIGLIPADRNQLERALINLLANAAKFTPEGGSISVTASREQAEVLLVVTDTGIGIPADEVEQLSTRFYRASNATERSIPGTGLGLTIVRNIVEHHGGNLEIASELGAGSTFAIRIPADRRTRPRPEAQIMGTALRGSDPSGTMDEEERGRA